MKKIILASFLGIASFAFPMSTDITKYTKNDYLVEVTYGKTEKWTFQEILEDTAKKIKKDGKKYFWVNSGIDPSYQGDKIHEGLKIGTSETYDEAMLLSKYSEVRCPAIYEVDEILK